MLAACYTTTRRIAMVWGVDRRMKLNCAFDWITEIGHGGANRSRMCLGRMASAADFPRGLSEN